MTPRRGWNRPPSDSRVPVLRHASITHPRQPPSVVRIPRPCLRPGQPASVVRILKPRPRLRRHGRSTSAMRIPSFGPVVPSNHRQLCESPPFHAPLVPGRPPSAVRIPSPRPRPRRVPGVLAPGPVVPGSHHQSCEPHPHGPPRRSSRAPTVICATPSVHAFVARPVRSPSVLRIPRPRPRPRQPPSVVRIPSTPPSLVQVGRNSDEYADR